jgi:DNA polymerase-3 subunit delta'
MKFEDILGQTQVIDKIEAMLKEETFPAVALFYGPEGTGKRLTAIKIAKALNCTNNNPPHSFFCNECASCEKIEKEIHPDIHILDREGDSIKIEKVREMIKAISQVQFEGRKKIAIINNAETLTLQAANALLKTLEEPPQNTNIILISSNTGKLPLTLKSRCYPLRFSPLDDDTIVEILARAEEQYSKDTLKIIAGISEGGVESAKSLLGADILNERRNFLQILDSQDYNIKNYALFSDEKFEGTELIQRELQVFKRLILDILFYKMSIYERIKNTDMTEDIKRISKRLDKFHLWSILKEIEQFETSLEMNVNLKLHQNLLLMNILKSGTG